MPPLRGKSSKSYKTVDDRSTETDEKISDYHCPRGGCIKFFGQLWNELVYETKNASGQSFRWSSLRRPPLLSRGDEQDVTLPLVEGNMTDWKPSNQGSANGSFSI
jgi:hypothetical protein